MGAYIQPQSAAKAEAIEYTIWFTENIVRRYNSLNLLLTGDFNLQLGDFKTQAERLNLHAHEPENVDGFFTRKGSKTHLDHIATSDAPGVLQSHET